MESTPKYPLYKKKIMTKKQQCSKKYRGMKDTIHFNKIKFKTKETSIERKKKKFNYEGVSIIL